MTLAQGNIEQNLKWEPEYLYQTLDIYHKLISQHLGKTDVIILPESALPVLENHIQPFSKDYKHMHNKLERKSSWGRSIKMKQQISY